MNATARPPSPPAPDLPDSLSPDERRLLEEIRALEPGLRTNRAIYDLLLKPKLLGYWTFLEPVVKKGFELTDVLVVFGDVAILIEAKTRAVPEEPSDQWLEEKISEGVRQIEDRVERLRSGEVRRLVNAWRGENPWDPTRVKYYYGLVVIAPTAPPRNPHAVARDAFEKAKVEVQVITLFDLGEVLRIFDTAYDVIVWYEMRRDYLRHQPALLGREQQAFCAMIELWDELWKRDPEQGRKLQEYFAELANAVLGTQRATAEGQSLWASSKLIDLCLRPLELEAPRDARGRPAPDDRHSMRIEVAEAFAEISRQRRSHYGRMLLEAADQAISTGRPAIRRSPSPSRSRSYAFLATPLGKEPTEWELAELGSDTLDQHDTESCVVAGASAASIRLTYDLLVRSIRREDPEPEPLPAGLVFNPKTGLIERR
jgi:hypothetical protein